MTAEVESIERDMQRYAREFKERGLPDYMWPGVRHHVRSGHSTGHFLTAILSNDLAEVVNRADDKNMALLKTWVMFLYNVLPSGCWGSKAKVKAWRKAGGLYGKEKAEKETG